MYVVTTNVIKKCPEKKFEIFFTNHFFQKEDNAIYCYESWCEELKLKFESESKKGISTSFEESKYDQTTDRWITSWEHESEGTIFREELYLKETDLFDDFIVEAQIRFDEEQGRVSFGEGKQLTMHISFPRSR